jgi:hypothetical protein
MTTMLIVFGQARGWSVSARLRAPGLGDPVCAVPGRRGGDDLALLAGERPSPHYSRVVFANNAG